MPGMSATVGSPEHFPSPDEITAEWLSELLGLDIGGITTEREGDDILIGLQLQGDGDALPHCVTQHQHRWQMWPRILPHCAFVDKVLV